MTGRWEDLVDFENDYSINTVFPYKIQNKRSGLIIKESKNKKGYPCVHLNRKTYLKHRLVAKQFVPRPQNHAKYNVVDHKNHDRGDYHINNLEWVTREENDNNRSIVNNFNYEYVNSLPKDSIAISSYDKHKLKNYFYSASKDKFYVKQRTGKYKVMHVIKSKRDNGRESINMKDTNGFPINVSVKKLKREINGGLRQATLHRYFG